VQLVPGVGLEVAAAAPGTPVAHGERVVHVDAHRSPVGVGPKVDRAHDLIPELRG